MAVKFLWTQCAGISYLSAYHKQSIGIFGGVCAGTEYMAGTMETHITNAHSSYGHKQSLYLDSFGCVISMTK